MCPSPPASGRLPDGAAVPVLGLAHVQRHTHVEALLPQADSTGGQVAGGIRWGRGTHCGPLSVSFPNTHSALALKMKHLHLLIEELYCIKINTEPWNSQATLSLPSNPDFLYQTKIHFNSFFSSVTTVGMEAAAAGHFVPSASCVRCFSTSALWMFSTLSRHWGTINPTWWTYWWGTTETCLKIQTF